MKRKRHAVRVPPITRVHNLYRFRFTANEMATLAQSNYQPTSVSFEKNLTKYHLSKHSTLKPRDRQGRRSRDHLASCTYLGLLDRYLIKNEYHYFPTPLGDKLSGYEFRDECPKDLDESAIFTTALLRFKLINGHYDDPTFKKLRHRPIITILNALRYYPLHLNQLYYLCGKITNDFVVDQNHHLDLLDEIGNIRYHSNEGVKQFINDFRLTDADIDEVNRSIRPWITWATQVGLITIDNDLFCRTTNKANILIEKFLEITPVWYSDLGSERIRKSVLLLLLQACSLEKKHLSKEFLSSSIEFEQRTFLTPANKLLLEELRKKYNFLQQNLRSLKKEIDFDFFYDIPSTKRRDVETAYNENAKELRLSTSLQELNLWSFKKVRQIISETSEEVELRNLSMLYGFAVPRKELFRVEFEYLCCVLLRRLGFNADKYQGNLSEMVREALKNFVENNPDLLVTNDIAFLIECKSKEEWSIDASFNKRILGEFKAYEDYADEVKANCAIFLVESEFSKQNFYIALQDELEKLKRVLVVSYSFLLNCLQTSTSLNKLKEVAQNPVQFKPHERLFIKA